MTTKRQGKYALEMKNGNAKLTNKQVRKIRDELEAGMTQAAVARRHGVSRQLVNAIAKGRRRGPRRPTSEPAPVPAPVGGWNEIRAARDLPCGAMATFRTHSRFGQVG